MGAEQKISASAYTHRGDEFTSNTGNFLLDGRQPFDFELDNSHVSIVDVDRNFFFAICDTKFTDDLNTSVSGIKELKKLHVQLKSGSRDIKSNTEILGECFVGTEDLLYDTAGYTGRENAGQPPGRQLSSLDKRLVTYAGKDMDEADGQIDGLDDNDGDGYAGRPDAGPQTGDEDDEFVDADDRDYEDDEEYDDEVEPPADIVELEPGKKGFSTVGFILSEKKGSILAQGDCEAFMFRSGSLRVLSGGSKKVSVTLNRAQGAVSQAKQYRGGGAQAKPYGGRSSEIFEPREGDVYLLCTTSVVTAIGEENIDGYLSLNEDLSAINGSIMYDAIKSDPSSNMTCVLVKIDEILDDEAPAAVSARRGADYGHQDMYGYNGGAQADGVAGAAAGSAGMAGGARPGAGPGPVGRPPQSGPPYLEQETRVSQTPYQNREAFSKRATSRFDAPPKKISLANNRSLITSIITTAALLLILFLSYHFLSNNDRNNSNGATGTGTTTTNVANAGTTSSANSGANATNADGSTQASTEGRTTTTTTTVTTTTTEPPEQEYTVKSGDTLQKIAQRFYGNANYALYTLIQERNGIQNPSKITIGQVLIIPPKPETTTETTTAAGGTTTEAQGAAATAGRQSASTTVR